MLSNGPESLFGIPLFSKINGCWVLTNVLFVLVVLIQPVAGTKRSAESTEGGEEITSPERPRRRQKSGWDSQEAPVDAGASREASTPSRIKSDGPPARDGDWVRESDDLVPSKFKFNILSPCNLL